MTVGKPDTLTFKWLSGILITIVFTLLGFWARDVSGQISIVKDKVSYIEGQLPSMNARLMRIEDNQDRIEQRRQ